MGRRFNILNAPTGLNQFYLQWRNALTVPPTATYEAALNQFFQDLDDSGILGVSPSDATGRKLSWLFLFGAETEEQALKSIIDPTHNASNVNGMTHQPGMGYRGQAGRYIDSNAPQFTFNAYGTYPNFSFGNCYDGWQDTNVAFSMAATTGLNGCLIRNRQASGGVLRGKIASSTFGGKSVPTGDGLSVGTKISNTEIWHKNGVNLGTNSMNNNTGGSGFNVFIHGVNSGGSYTNGVTSTLARLNMAFWSTDLTDTEQQDLSNAVKLYFDTIGLVSPIP